MTATHINGKPVEPGWDIVDGKLVQNGKSVVLEPKSSVVLPFKRNLDFTPASAIEPAATLWAWLQRLALGEMGLLAGREGVGKSTLGYNVSSQLSLGKLEGDLYGKPKGHTGVCHRG
jgi:hypothetical protein